MKLQANEGEAMKVQDLIDQLQTYGHAAEEVVLVIDGQLVDIDREVGFVNEAGGELKIGIFPHGPREIKIV
jgi:hypothetical protein